jgi:hypothetical protein
VVNWLTSHHPIWSATLANITGDADMELEPAFGAGGENSKFWTELLWSSNIPRLLPFMTSHI